MGAVEDALARYEASPSSPAPAKNVTPAPADGAAVSDVLARYGAAPAKRGRQYTAPAPGTTFDPLAAGGDLLKRLGVPKVIEALDRPRQGTQNAIAGKGFTLGGVSPEDQDTNRKAVRTKLGMETGYEDPRLFGSGPGTFGIPVPEGVTHAMRGIEDFAVDTGTDPTILGGKVHDFLKLLGVTGRVAEAARPVTAPIARAASTVKTKAAAAVPQLVKDNAQAIADRFTYGAGAKRALGEPKFDQAIAADNRQAALEQQAAALLTKRFDAHIGALPDADRIEVYRYLNGERDLRGMTPAQAAAATEGRRLTTQAGGMYADEAGRRKLAYGGGKLMSSAQLKPRAPKPPADESIAQMAERLFGAGSDASLIKKVHATPGVDIAAPVGDAAKRKLVGRVDRNLDLGEMGDFAAPAEQGRLGAENVRARYLPSPVGDKSLVDPDAAAQSFNLLNPRAVNAQQGEAFTVDPKDLGAIDESFRNMLAQGARQGTAGRMRDELGVKLGSTQNNPDLINLFERESKARGDARSLGQRNAEVWQNLVNIPKNTVSTIGLKHGLINVPALAFQSEGLGAAKDALVGGIQALRRKPEDDFAAHLAGIKGGVITPFADRANPIADTLAKIPGGVGAALGGASEKANRLTWAIDDAAKQAVFLRKYQRLRGQGLAHGEAADKAAAQTLREMVDYRHTSDATNKLKNIAPFATFRSKIPAAVLSSIARNPGRLMTADRATSGLFGSGKVGVPGVNDQGKPNRFYDTNPISDVLELPGDPNGVGMDRVPGFKYARSMIADPLKALLSAPGDAAEAAGVSPRLAELMRYFTYGQHVLPYAKDGKLKAGFLGQSAAGYIPGGLGEEALGLAGGSDFPTPDPLSLLLGGTVGGYVR